MIIQENRELSGLIARETAVRHESPQVLLFRDGRVTWSASHGGVTLEAMTSAVAEG
jgi:bacillithiol system protein YtxJ